MNYLNQAKKGVEERANAGRMSGRMAVQEPIQGKDLSDDNFIVGPVSDPSSPSETSSIPAELNPKEVTKPIETHAPKKTKKSKNSDKKATDEETDPNKEKYSIYLPKKLSTSLRMVYLTTRKKFSHVAEAALTDMLYRRYQCLNPACMAWFSISESDKAPTCCPVCGKKDIQSLRLDKLE